MLIDEDRIGSDWEIGSIMGIHIMGTFEEFVQHPPLFWGYPIHIEMDCGAVLDIPDAAAFPRESLPCSCGAPNRWFVRYRQPGDE